MIAEEARLEPSLIVGVAQQFLPTDQILAFGKLAEYLSHLPEEKPNSKVDFGSGHLVGVVL